MCCPLLRFPCRLLLEQLADAGDAAQYGRRLIGQEDLVGLAVGDLLERFEVFDGLGLENPPSRMYL